MKRFLALTICILLAVAGCAGMQEKSDPINHELTITIKQVGENKVEVVATNGDEKISRSMEISNPGMQLSQLSGISGNKCFIKIFSGISVSDVTRTWNDLIYLENETKIRDVHLFIDSPGGDAFQGLALADTIEKYQKRGFHFTAHATGIIASATVPIFAVADVTRATKATIFMVHEAALWKWPGRETASDIRSQGKMMNLLQKLYIDKLVQNSNLDFDQWEVLEAKTAWFGAERAKEIGILDHIE
jgi:ATP-dependent Clp protease protease subunit